MKKYYTIEVGGNDKVIEEFIKDLDKVMKLYGMTAKVTGEFFK